MLMNFRELVDWVYENIPEDIYEFSIAKETPKNCDLPIKFTYLNKYERIGYAQVWNDFGTIEFEFPMYRPIGGGTVLYDVN